MVKSIESFLDAHAKEIIGFRRSQLKQYQRNSIADAPAYTGISDSVLNDIKSSILPFTDSQIGDSETAAAVLELLSVDPIYMSHMISSPALTMIYMDHMDLPFEKMTPIFSKIAIGGNHLSTKLVDKTNWIIALNNYYTIFEFSFELKSGEMELLSIKTRNLDR